MELLSWIENTAMVTWVRESSSLLGYTMYLAGHTIGLVLLLGPNLIIAAKVLGVVPELPLRPMRAFKPVMVLGGWITVVSGTVLFACAPVSYVQNVVFLVKLGAIAVALVLLRALVHEVLDAENPDAGPLHPRVRRLTIGTLVFWAIAVVAGRLTAYSGVVVIASLGAFAVVTSAITIVGFLVRSRGVRAPRDTSFTVPVTALKEGK